MCTFQIAYSYTGFLSKFWNEQKINKMVMLLLSASKVTTFTWPDHQRSLHNYFKATFSRFKIRWHFPDPSQFAEIPWPWENIFYDLMATPYMGLEHFNDTSLWITSFTLSNKWLTISYLTYRIWHRSSVVFRCIL